MRKQRNNPEGKEGSRRDDARTPRSIQLDRSPSVLDDHRLLATVRPLALASNVVLLLSAGACGVFAGAPLLPYIGGLSLALVGLLLILLGIVNVGLVLAPVPSRTRRGGRRLAAVVNAPIFLAALVWAIAGATSGGAPALAVSGSVLAVATGSAAICHTWPRVEVTDWICAWCGYDLRNRHGARCPECGFQGVGRIQEQ